MSEHNCQLTRRSASKVLHQHWAFQDAKAKPSPDGTGYRDLAVMPVPPDLLEAAKARLWGRAPRTF